MIWKLCNRLQGVVLFQSQLNRVNVHIRLNFAVVQVDQCYNAAISGITDHTLDVFIVAQVRGSDMPNIDQLENIIPNKSEMALFM